MPAAPHRLSRRAFLQIGSLGLGGRTLPGLLRAESAAGVRPGHKSVILIYLVGGPPHQDLFDLKPDAPREFAGPWRPAATNVPGKARLGRTVRGEVEAGRLVAARIRDLAIVSRACRIA